MAKDKEERVVGTTGLFSESLLRDLRSILGNEFGRTIDDDAILQEIGLRLVEFIAAKERLKNE